MAWSAFELLDEGLWDGLVSILCQLTPNRQNLKNIMHFEGAIYTSLPLIVSLPRRGGVSDFWP